MLEPVFEEVLSAAQVGADWAWTEIFETYSGPVLGYVRSHGAHEPEDLVSEVFVQLARNIATFEGDESSFRSWVFVVAHHRIIDERRRRTRRPQTPVPEVFEDVSKAFDDTSTAAMDRLRTMEIQSMIEELAPTQRDVLLLRIVAGLTVPEIAAAIGKTPGAVKALQRRGLQSLARQIDKNKGVT